MEINPKFRRIESVSSPGLTPNNGTNDHHHEKLRLEQEGLSTSLLPRVKSRSPMLIEMSKRAAEIKNAAAASYQHNEFIKVLIEQQKLVQQQELEHKQKLQQEQQVHILFFPRQIQRFSCSFPGTRT